MAIVKLSEAHLAVLRPLEAELKRAVAAAEPDAAIEAAAKIQGLLDFDRNHHRLLRAKLWAFEACIDANRLSYAERGLIGVRNRAGSTTRLSLEAGALLAVVLLRQKKTQEAKRIVKDVIENINNIASDRTRHQFQKRLIARIEEECVLAELIGTEEGPMDAEEVQAKAVLLLQRNSDDEILKLIGNSVPVASVKLLSDVRSYSILQLPASDRKLLPPPEKAQEPKSIGKVTFAVLRRVAWKTFCKADSPVYKMWSKKIPEVFNQGYFSAAVLSTFGDFRIGLPLVASGIAALVMKYSAEEFCALAKPKGLMISGSDKEI
ncbi:hypothetical protein M4R22_08740 [Acidovorax sp. GBBC 3334]|uniref:hypothetical protein n=1 Tax=Acidovorax sp. GBBC 3334 TaxID=2940496 RepID=UPI002302160C|nr:hypothetical protein [Acidovorax sp. GBBC 3334]MDA8454848.1 hypothetical protein [Acidovorax sp. GBBC 3334]